MRRRICTEGNEVSGEIGRLGDESSQRHRNQALICEQERDVQALVSLHIRAHQPSGIGAEGPGGSSSKRVPVV